VNHKRRSGPQANAYKHGHGRHGPQSSEYRTWSGMKGRCMNPKNPKFLIYGGRGITVRARWMEFLNFLADMGPKPTPSHSIERVDRNGNYEPGNCIWATQSVQQRNRSTNRILTFNGVTKTMTDFAADYGLRVGTLWNRLDLGWPIKSALTLPLGSRKP
jgi:hypothetical protein